MQGDYSYTNRSCPAYNYVTVLFMSSKISLCCPETLQNRKYRPLFTCYKSELSSKTSIVNILSDRKKLKKVQTSATELIVKLNSETKMNKIKYIYIYIYIYSNN